MAEPVTVAQHLDPVTLSLIQNRLDYISRQMGWVMTRTARSPIFSQSHDFSCFITDRDGTVVSQADGIPIHTGGGGFAIRALLRDFSDDIADQDVFLLNDPYVAGGNHLPDWVIARPVFVQNQRVAFCCNRAHQSDIGGGAAGTYNPAATEIFHEGIRLPPLRLIERGVVRKDLWQLLLLNTRCPDLLDGDLHAMLGSTQIGCRQSAQLVAELGVDTSFAYFAAILDHADRSMRAMITALPDGTYRAEEQLDTDCFEPVDVRIRASVTIKGDEATIDFTGTDRQIRGFKNSSLANTHSAVYAAFASFFDATLPRNEGAFRALRIIAPAGTVINALPPAPLTMCTVFPAHEIMHVCWWALGQADPKRSIGGWGKNCFPVTSGTDGSGRTWVMYHWGACSGAGAVEGRDGFNQIGPMVTLGGLSLPNAEVYEHVYPVTILRQEFRCDTAGAGEFRGGSGVDYVVEMHATAEYSFRGEGLARPTGLGVTEGRSGAVGILHLDQAGRSITPQQQYALKTLGPCQMSISSPGGGGIGNPVDRRPEAVLRDVRDGIVSHAAARTCYGVVIADDGRTVDAEKTALRRKEMRASHGTENNAVAD